MNAKSGQKELRAVTNPCVSNSTQQIDVICSCSVVLRDIFVSWNVAQGESSHQTLQLALGEELSSLLMNVEDVWNGHQLVNEVGVSPRIPTGRTSDGTGVRQPMDESGCDH